MPRRKLPPRDLMNVAGIAELVGVSRARVSQLRADPEFPAPLDTPHVQGIPLWDREEVMLWLAHYRARAFWRRDRRYHHIRERESA